MSSLNRPFKASSLRSSVLSAASWLLLVSARLQQANAFSSTSRRRSFVPGCLQGRRESLSLGSSAAVSTCEEEPSSSPSTTRQIRSTKAKESTTTNAVTAATNSAEDTWSARVAASVFEESTNPVLLFDGVCNLCNDAVNLCLDLDPAERFRFASLQSKVGRALLIQNGRNPDDRSTMVLVTASFSPKHNNVENDLQLDCFTHSDAVLRIASQLDGLPKVLRWSARAATAIVPQWARDAVLKFVGRNRHLLGETEGPQCRLDLDGVYEKRFLEDPDLE